MPPTCAVPVLALHHEIVPQLIHTASGFTFPNENCWMKKFTAKMFSPPIVAAMSSGVTSPSLAFSAFCIPRYSVDHGTSCAEVRDDVGSVMSSDMLPLSSTSTAFGTPSPSQSPPELFSAEPSLQGFAAIATTPAECTEETVCFDTKPRRPAPRGLPSRPTTTRFVATRVVGSCVTSL